MLINHFSFVTDDLRGERREKEERKTGRKEERTEEGREGRKEELKEGRKAEGRKE